MLHGLNYLVLGGFGDGYSAVEVRISISKIIDLAFFTQNDDKPLDFFMWNLLFYGTFFLNAKKGILVPFS